MKSFCEIPNPNWTLAEYLKIPIDRNGPSALAYLNDYGVNYQRGFFKSANLCVQLHTGRKKSFTNYFKNRIYNLIPLGRNCLNFIAEPREIAPYAFEQLPEEKTYSLTPRQAERRFFFPLSWEDPQFESWSARQDQIVWFARPYPWRVELAKKMLEKNIPLVIYSYEPWPLPCYRGPAENYDKTARRYRYQLVYEPSQTQDFHSEKFFKSVSAGCVTFFGGSTDRDLSFLKSLTLPVSDDSMIHRDQYSQKMIENISDFVFSEKWKIYSSQQFFDRILKSMGVL